jgi:hypothetical protein
MRDASCSASQRPSAPAAMQYIGRCAMTMIHGTVARLASAAARSASSHACCAAAWRTANSAGQK